MSKRFVAVALGAILVVAVLAAYGIGQKLAGPRVSVSPAANLIDGDTVSVRLAGFSAGSSVQISECATVAASMIACSSELGPLAVVQIGSDGSGSASVAISSQAAAGQLSNAPQACSIQCVIQATASDGSAFVVAPIAFQEP